MNRYAPPRSESQEPIARGRGEAHEPRPFVIWPMLILAWLFALLFAAGALVRSGQTLTSGAPLWSAADAAILASVAGAFLVLALAIHRRRPRVARWLGPALFALSAAAVLLAGAPDASCRSSVACHQGWWWGRLSVALGLVAVGWVGSWSGAARRYHVGDRRQRSP